MNRWTILYRYENVKINKLIQISKSSDIYTVKPQYREPSGGRNLGLLYPGVYYVCPKK